VALNSKEASDLFNFVMKDDSCNAWYDHYGTNFKVGGEKRGDRQTGPPLQALCNAG
jgi:hypothetical protein